MIKTRISILYDNTAVEGFEADWGFSCLVEFQDRKILFDTGANRRILLSNMEKLNISSQEIEEVFISHSHWDHTGGLQDFLRENKEVTLYVPPSFSASGAKEVKTISEAQEIHEKIYSTGELKGIEQSLGVKTEKGVVVIAGCSHPGVGNILDAASKFGKIHALIGGLHGFSQFDLLEDLSLICPTHCTQHISEIRAKFPDKTIEGGAGRVIEI